MTTTLHFRPIAPDYTGAWNQARFLHACELAGVPVGMPKAAAVLARKINSYREARGVTEAISPIVVRRWLSGERDPSLAAGGRPPSAYDLAGALGVSLDWLLGGRS